MSTAQIKAILFDMDGTLINSEDYYLLQLNGILLECFDKGPLEQEILVEIQGRPGIKIAEIITRELGLNATAEEFYNLTNSPERLEIYKNCSFLPGMKELVMHLKLVKNLPIAIATSTTKLKYDSKTSHLNDCGFELFDDIVTGGDVPQLKGRGKPNPDIWWYTLDRLNELLELTDEDKISIKDCLIFEDSFSGIQSAIASGAHSVWIPSNKGSLQALDHDQLDDKCEILDSIREFNKSKYGL